MMHTDPHGRGSLWQRARRLFDSASNSLVKKIILLTCLAVLLSATLISVVNYSRLKDIAMDSATEKLAGETRLIAQSFKLSYDEIASDVKVLSLTPAIQGIIRARENGGIDPMDGSSEDTWKERLAAIFVSVMRARSHYAQVRLVGLADDGREIVRVNRVPFGVEAVDDDALQKKAGELYFEETVFKRSTKVEFSDITFNRENGLLDDTMTLMIRAILPVYDMHGKMFGMIIINTPFEHVFGAALNFIGDQNETLVLDINGDLTVYRRDENSKRFTFLGKKYRTLPEAAQMLISTSSGETQTRTDQSIAYMVRRPMSDDAYSTIAIILETPRQAVMAPVMRTLDISVAVSIALVFLCLVLSLVMARRFSRPIGAMIGEIEKTENFGQLPSLPLNRNDEFGALARAFHCKASDLLESQTKKRSILDNILDGVVTIDSTGAIDIFNPSCERIFGYTAAEAVGRNISILVPPPVAGEHDKYLARYLNTGDARILGITREVSARRKDGSVFPIELSISELIINGNRQFIGTIRDITERKQIEIMKDEFVSTVNHEIRTPLTAVQGSLGLLRKTTADRLDDKSRGLLDLSYRNCLTLTRLVNDILDFEKISSGKDEYDFAVSDICAVVRGTVAREAESVRKYGVTFALHCDDGPIRAAIDMERFNQALGNVLSNAAKFSPHGGIVDIAVYQPTPDQVRIGVTDRGPGIPDQFRETIFKKFVQIDGSATRTKGGSGLGLAIARSIIEAHDGTIDFVTSQGYGTTFTLVLPVVTEHAVSTKPEPEPLGQTP